MLEYTLDGGFVIAFFYRDREVLVKYQLVRGKFTCTSLGDWLEGSYLSTDWGQFSSSRLGHLSQE